MVLSLPATLINVLFPVQDPNLAPMAPQLRAMFNNPQFREMLSNPDSLRQMFQMSAQMRAAGVDPTNPATFGSGLGGLGAFGLPPFGFGAGASGAGTGSNAADTAAGSGPTNLFSQAAGGGGAGTGSTTAGTGGSTGAGLPSPNPFGMVDPNLMTQLLGGYGGFSGFPGAGSTPSAPADTRPVEERFQVSSRPSTVRPLVHPLTRMSTQVQLQVSQGLLQ